MTLSEWIDLLLHNLRIQVRIPVMPPMLLSLRGRSYSPQRDGICRVILWLVRGEGALNLASLCNI